MAVAPLRMWRGEKATNLAAMRSKVIDRVVLQRHEEELADLDRLMEQEWVRETSPMRIPRLIDFLSLEIAEREMRRTWVEQPRVYDEKFHILQAPAQVRPDLDYFRAASAARNRGVALAYIDIDALGEFNRAHGEPFMDQFVLPRLMGAIEATVFGRGFAYREGGDEVRGPASERRRR